MRLRRSGRSFPRHSRCFCLFAGSSVLLMPAPLRAQEALDEVTSAGDAAPKDEEEDDPVEDAPNQEDETQALDIELPVLVEAPPPNYPELPDSPRKEASVALSLSIDIEGKVTDAQVRETGGQAFDEEAMRVARLYRFIPAKKSGVAVAARILVRVDFIPPVPSPAPVPVAPVVEPPKVEDEKPSPEEPIEEVHVLGEQDEAKKLAQSADSVTVVDLSEQKQRSSDMGEVLARTPGLVVRRTGGVGSDVRISLNGLYDRAVREFVDGVPLWMTAFPENVGSLPVNLFDRVEVYRGVVPLRLAADALGGAINFVTDRSYENHASASFQAGSYGTYRGTLLAQYRHDRTNFVARVVGYVDEAKNNYKVDVEVPDESGRLSAVTVPLFHKAYAASGVLVEAGLVEKPWAERLLVRGFVSGSRTEIQHNQVMSVPYGEPWWSDDSAGAALLYDQDFGNGIRLDTTTNYSHRKARIEDLGEYVYNWYGERVRERVSPGEITTTSLDRQMWRNAVFHRSTAEWEIVPEHTIFVSVTPFYSTQTGRDNNWNADAPDPLSARNTILSFVNGVGHELNLIPMPGAREERQLRRRGTDFRLQNTLNAKSYIYRVDSTEALPAGGFRTHRTETHDFGIGDGVRFALTKSLFLKASYEYARRLPDPFEIFGDGALVAANLELVPEVSHNANFGPLLDLAGTRAGDFMFMANLAYRSSHDMIVLLGNLQYLTYRNVYAAETWSGESGLSWTSPRKYMTLDWSGTYNDSRNRSTSGAFAAFEGDAIPNRSPFSTSWGARLRFENVFLRRDRIEPFYQGRYTAGFFRSWESQGITEFKDRVESQFAHDAGLTYESRWEHLRLTNTIEVQNLTDARLYDDFGVQRPGRAFYFKVTAEVL